MVYNFINYYFVPFIYTHQINTNLKFFSENIPFRYIYLAYFATGAKQINKFDIYKKINYQKLSDIPY